MKSLRNRIFVAMLGVALFPALVSLIANFTLTRKDMLTAKHQEIQSLAEELSRGLHGIMRSAHADLKSISTNPILTASNDTDAELKLKIGEFQRLKRIYKTYTSISLLNQNGWELDSTDVGWTGVQDKTKWCLQALKGEEQVTLPQFSDREGAISLNVYKPVKSPDQKILAVVRGTVDFARISELLSGVKLGTAGYVIMTDVRGKILHHSDKTKLFHHLSEVHPISLGSARNGLFESPDGRRFIYDVTYVPQQNTLLSEGWNLISILPYHEAIEIAAQTSSQQTFIAGLSVLVGSLIGLFLGRHISGHISDAASAAAKVKAGDLDSRLPETGPEEMVALATSFNSMTREVKFHREALEEKVAQRTQDLASSQEELEVLAAQLKAAFEASRSAIALIRADGQLIAANSQFERTFGFDITTEVGGYPPALSNRLATCLADPIPFLAAWEKADAGSYDSIDLEMDVILPTNRTIQLFSAAVHHGEGPPVARIWNFRDITETRELEMSLRQAQKMEAVGRLAGGVAHDFNNLLQAILGNIALIELDVGPFALPAASERIAMARNAGQRAAQIVRQLMSFSRLSHVHLAHCNINLVIKELHSIISSTFDPMIEIALQLQEDSWKLRADATQIEQVVMNMVVNARDALGETGKITITTRNIEVSETQIPQMPGSRPGEFVRISVSDNGSGMHPEVISKIFEPFFTTKEQGKGTGLGLSTSFGIVQQHRGWIVCESEVGTGTTFHIFLPRSFDTVVKVLPLKVVPESPVRGGGETILVVDDEVVVRAVAQGLLKKLGYQVVTADNGEAALEMLHRMDGGIHLCLLDLTMPRLSGKDAFAAMRRGPSRNVPVVICSGYLLDLDAFASDTGSRPDAFVQKPYALDDLARTIRRVLDASQAALVIA